MSHQLVAQVWEQLLRPLRPDVTNILREIIGEHAVELAESHVHGGLPTNLEPLTRLITWTRAIFDLQRTHLLTSIGVNNGLSLSESLVSSDVVFSTLMYLIKWKSEISVGDSANSQIVTQHVLHVSQALISGVRLLLLRGEAMSVDKKARLEDALRPAWQSSTQSDTQRYLVMELLPRAIHSIGVSRPGESYFVPAPSHSSHVQGYGSGLYQCLANLSTLVRSLLSTLLDDHKNHHSAFWALYDICWAVDSAIIQCHIERRLLAQEEGSTRNAALQVAEAQQAHYATRMSLERAIARARTEEYSLPLEVLAFSFYGSKHSSPPSMTSTSQDSDHGMSTATDLALNRFIQWLAQRRIKLWGCNGEFEQVSRDYHQSLKQWMQSAAPCDTQQHDLGKRGGVVYMVDCPSMHPVPRTLLEERLRGVRSDSYERLRRNSHLLDVDIFCPLCPGRTRIQHARLIEPLEQLSNALPLPSESDSSLSRRSILGSISQPPTSRSSSVSHSTGHSSSQGDQYDITSPPLSPAFTANILSKVTSNPSIGTVMESMKPPLRPTTSEPSPGTPSVKSPSKEAKSSKLTFLSRTNGRKPTKDTIVKKSSKDIRLPSDPRFGYSSSGKSLLLWAMNGSWVMRFDIPVTDGGKQHSHRYNVSGVQFAAMGSQRCVMIASVAEHHELLVFDGDSITPCASAAIDAPGRQLGVCLVVSRDDGFAAFTTKDQVHVYCLGSRSVRKIELADQIHSYPIYGECPVTSPQSRRPLSAHEVIQEEQSQRSISERKVQFSVDSKRLVVATHLANNYAYVDVWNCESEPWRVHPGNSRSFKLPPNMFKDGDLTCIFYDSRPRFAFMTAFLGKEYPMLIPLLDNICKLNNGRISAKIAHAAQSPSGSRYAFANGMSNLYICDYKADGTLNPCRLKKAEGKISAGAFTPGHIALSFPLETTVLVSWIKDGALLARCITLSEHCETFTDLDLRGEFERLSVEQVPPVSYHDPPLPVLESAQPDDAGDVVAEMEGSVVSRRTRFSELP